MKQHIVLLKSSILKLTKYLTFSFEIQMQFNAYIRVLIDRKI
jgi:hypothetical protein